MDLNKSINHAVSVREAGKLTASKILFEKLVKVVDKSDPLYVRLMAEYVIQLRLDSKSITSKALKIGKDLASDYPDNPSAIRALAHSLSDLGGYELTEPMFRKMIDLYPDNSLKKGEEQAHLAYILLRSAHIKEASMLINLAIDNIQHNTASENYTEVRESYAFFVKSLIENAMGNKEIAKQCALKALQIAEDGKSTFRIAQAKELLTLFEYE